ncbi:MAG: small subunit ribosomal protein S18 [Puniceicoccaceae bacterium 5H]|nr:MAG: small subunit ribosomal protein S18 [Puniceicoccaceae bacterium 5H]
MPVFPMSNEPSEERQNFKNPQDLTMFDVEQLQRYVTDTGKILPRKFTGLNAQQQRHVTKIIKRARNMLLMK